jgi:hypothetical protein
MQSPGKFPANAGRLPRVVTYRTKAGGLPANLEQDNAIASP